MGVTKFYSGWTELSIALTQNKTLGKYMITFIHEFLHVMFTRFIPLLFGVVYTDHSEHRFIKVVEEAIEKASKLLVEKKKKP